MGFFSELGEQVTKRLIEPAAQLGAKFIGRGGKAAAEKALEKVEPTLAKEAEQTAAKGADDALKSSYDTAGKTAKKKTSSFDDQKAVQDRLDAAAGKGAKTAEKETAKETAEKTTETAAKDAADAAAGNGKRLNWWQRMKMFYSGEHKLVNTELVSIARRSGGVVKETDKAAMADMEKVLAKHRARGITPEEARDLAREPGVPQSIKDKVQKYADARDPVLRTVVGHTFERVAAKWDYFTHYPVYSVTKPIVNAVVHPIDTVGSVWSNGKKYAYAALGLDVAYNAYSASTNPATADHVVFETAKKTGADVVKTGVKAVELGAKGVGMLPGEWAEKKAKQIIEWAPGAAVATIGAAAEATSGATAGVVQGIDDTSKGNEGQKMGIVKEGVEHVVKGVVKEEVKKAQVNETGLPGPGTTAPAAAAAGSTPDKKPEAADSEPEGMSDEEKVSYGKMSIAERKKFAQQKAEEALHIGEREMEKLVKKYGNDPGAIFGAFMGFDKNKDVKSNLANMGIMATLGHFIWPFIQQLFGGMFGGNRGGAYARHNYQMDQAQYMYSDMRHGAATRFTPNGVLPSMGVGINNTAPVGPLRPVGAPMVMLQQQPQQFTPNGAVPVGGMNNTAPVGPLTPVGPQPISAAQQVNSTPIQTTVDPKTAADQASYEAMIQKVSKDSKWADDKVKQVTNVDNVPTYTYGAAAPAPDKKPDTAPVVEVKGIERSYGAPNPNITDDSRKKAYEQVRIANPELSLN